MNDGEDKLDLEQFKALLAACLELRESCTRLRESCIPIKESAQALLARAKQFYQDNFE